VREKRCFVTKKDKVHLARNLLVMERGSEKVRVREILTRRRAG